MAVIPENEKVIQLDMNDDEGWVDTHHNVRELEQYSSSLPPPHYHHYHTITTVTITTTIVTSFLPPLLPSPSLPPDIAAEVVGDMTLEGDKPTATTSSTSEDMALVGRATNDDDDSDSDDEPAMDIEDYPEEEDPVSSGRGESVCAKRRVVLRDKLNK